ncbi:MAG TPA: PQQ-dependent sugar dehydrogenase [Candidatus Acidoferrum sp.]|nr:PQQ-dependent sugar dehydrogenase [Candidatus Acidoferrum sp.]
MKPIVLSLGLALSAFTAVAAEPIPTLKLLGERFVQPTVLVPIDGERLFVADQIGRLFIVHKDGAGTNKLALELSPQQIKFKSGGFDERGLVGIAMHPKFAQNQKFYAYYSAPLREGAETNWNHTSHISEFTLKNDKAGDERLLLQIDMPYENHHGGPLAFGPDGFLYISVGDGGNANDVGRGHSPQGNGQDTKKLLGKILRIDVDKKDEGKQYAVPKDNPFASNGKGRPEIFAWGLRNPWGISFDRGGERQFFVADVGQDSWEEVNIVTKGGNYGWNIREAFVCFDPKKTRQPPADCPKVGAMGEPLLDPILSYKNIGKFPKDPEAKGCSITGGYVYRGKLFPQLVGNYIFADWSRGWTKPDGVLFAATRGVDGKWTMETLALAGSADGSVGHYVTALGQDADGEIYVMTNTSNMIKENNGKLWKLAAQ